MTLLDLSHFQADAGSVDYPKVRQSVAGAYLKLTQGTTYTDPAWRKHHDGLEGVPRGGYHFAGRMDVNGTVTYQDPTQEAQTFATALTQATWELRPVLDIEAPGATPAWLTAFLTALRGATGIRRLRVYTSYALVTTSLAPNLWIDPGVDLWIARYNPTLGYDHPKLVLWQHTQTGALPGITGPVDLSTEMHGWTPAEDQLPDNPSPQETEPVTPIPLTVGPDGTFRATVMAEVGSTSRVVDEAWITYGTTWGSTQFTVCALDINGVVMPGGMQKGTLANNHRAYLALPSGCVMATIEGQTTTGAVPAAALVIQPK